MCSTSAISDYYLQQWPARFPANPSPFTSGDPELKDLMRKALEILDRIDKRLGDVECRDALKSEFLKQVGFEGTG
jgi:hypothetical protein